VLLVTMYQGLTQELAMVMPNAVATGLFVSLFTALMPDGGLGPSGAPDNNYIPVTTLTNIHCTAPPPSEARIQATEVKGLEEIMSAELKHVLLSGYYPAIETSNSLGWQCLIDGTQYDILGGESDSQKQMTRVEVRLASY
jgi:hypothetical protein